MASYANNLRSLAAMITAERATQSETQSQLDKWLPLFLAALIPDGTASVTPDVGRAELARDLFDVEAIVAVSLAAWRKRYKKNRKAGYSQAAEDRFAAEVRATISLVPNRSFEVARAAIKDGFRSGKSAVDIMNDVHAAVLDAAPITSERTGRLIGPTAINDATLSAYTDAEQIDGEGPYLKSWVSLFDGRTRPSHLDAGADPANDRIPLSQKFQVGDELADYPRDDSLSIDEKANCRCIAAIELA